MNDTTEPQRTALAPHYASVGMMTFGTGGSLPALQNLADVVSIAQLMAKSGVAVPKHLRENPGACLAVTMFALRIEFDPWAVANKSYSVNDRLAYEAQLLNAIILTRSPIAEEPDYEYEGVGDKRVCTVSIKMTSGKTLKISSPEFGRITPKNSPLWKSDPDQQQGYYTIRLWARRHQPHVILGVYDREEMQAEEMTNVTPQGSGVMSRLDTRGHASKDGFDANAIDEVLGEEVLEVVSDPQPDPEPTKPKRGRPSKAEMEVRAKALGEAKKTAQAGQAPEERVEAVTELPNQPETASEAEFTPLDPSDPDAWQVLDEIDGPAPRDEHYTLADDEPKNGKLPVYMNGEKIGEIGPEESGQYNSYTDHADDGIIPVEFPGDKPFSKIATGLQDAIAITEGTADPETYRVHPPKLTGAFAKFWDDYIQTEASSWPQIKDALRLLQATQDYKNLTPAEQNAWRRLAGQAIAAKVEAGEFQIDPLDDVTAFRYALETWDDAEFVVQMWEELQGMALYEGLAQNLKDALAKAVAERITVLEAP